MSLGLTFDNSFLVVFGVVFAAFSSLVAANLHRGSDDFQLGGMALNFRRRVIIGVVVLVLSFVLSLYIPLYGIPLIFLLLIAGVAVEFSGMLRRIARDYHDADNRIQKAFAGLGWTASWRTAKGKGSALGFTVFLAVNALAGLFLAAFLNGTSNA